MELTGVAVREQGQVFGLSVFTVSVDPANAGAVASVDTVVTVPGVAVGDLVIAIPPVNLTAGLAPQAAVVTGANAVTIRLTNPSAGAIDGAALVWTLLVLDRTPLL